MTEKQFLWMCIEGRLGTKSLPGKKPINTQSSITLSRSYSKGSVVCGGCCGCLKGWGNGVYVVCSVWGNGALRMRLNDGGGVCEGRKEKCDVSGLVSRCDVIAPPNTPTTTTYSNHPPIHTTSPQALSSSNSWSR